MVNQWAALVTGVVLAGSLPADARAQPSPVLLTQEEARAHLVSAPSPTYPALAQAANIEGIVDVEVAIAPDGTVTNVRVLVGVPVLDGAASDAAREWRFKPLMSGGAPVSVRTGLTFFFALSPPKPEQVAAAVGLNDAILLCLHQVDRGAFTEAEQACLSAASIAARVRPSRNAPALASRLLGDALAGLGRHEEAIARFRAALGRSMGASDMDRVLAEWGLGRSLAASGQMRDALRAFDRAQNRLAQRTNAIPRDSPHRVEPASHLRPVLTEYVELLEQAGDTRRAQRMRERLASLE